MWFFFKTSEADGLWKKVTATKLPSESAPSSDSNRQQIIYHIHRWGITLWSPAQDCGGPSFAVKIARTFRGMHSTTPLKVCCGKLGVGPPWIELVCQSHSRDAQLDWELRNLEAKWTLQTRCCARQTILEPSLWQGMLSSWNRSQSSVSTKGWTWSAGPNVTQQNIAKSIALPLLV